jgi:Na+-driven multidrug efflux pump
MLGIDVVFRTQAYGAKNYAAVGVTLQRALLICLVALAALLPLWIAMEPVLLALGAL